MISPTLQMYMAHVQWHVDLAEALEQHALEHDKITTALERIRRSTRLGLIAVSVAIFFLFVDILLKLIQMF